MQTQYAPKELFTVHLVKLPHDMFYCIVETGDDDMLDGIHTAVTSRLVARMTSSRIMNAV